MRLLLVQAFLLEEKNAVTLFVLFTLYTQHTLVAISRNIHDLYAEGQVFIKGLTELGDLSLQGIQSDLTAGNTGLLLVSDLQLGKVLQDGPDETIGSALRVLLESAVHGVEVGADLDKVKLLPDGRADVGLRIRGQRRGKSLDQGLVILHIGQRLLDRLRRKDVPIDLGILGVDNLRRSSQPTGVGVSGEEGEGSRGREGLLNECAARSLALGHGKGRVCI